MGLFLIANLGLTQKGVEDGSKYGHGEDSINCIKNLSLYREYARQNAYKDARPFWRKVFRDCPRSSKNIYIDGVKMYRSFIEEEQNPENQGALIDTLMMIYDQRIKYYRQKGYVLGRKGVDLLRYRRDKVEYRQEGYNYLKESIELKGDKSSDAVLATFMTTSISLYDDGVLEPGQVIQDYEKVSGIFEKKLEKDPNDRTVKRLVDNIEQNMVGCGVLDCETLIRFFEPKFNANPKDIDLLTKLTDFMDKLDCTDSDLYYDALTNRHEIEPSSGSSKLLALLSMKRDNYEKASQYYKQAIEYEEDSEVTGDLYYGLAIATEKMGDKPQARTYALKAIELKPNWGEPYILIGNLYADSVNDCSSLKLPKAVYWAAVDKFQKAKAVDPEISEKADRLINTYAGYYPNKEEAFFNEVHEGDTYLIECWINERTTARF